MNLICSIVVSIDKYINMQMTATVEKYNHDSFYNRLQLNSNNIKIKKVIKILLKINIFVTNCKSII